MYKYISMQRGKFFDLSDLLDLLDKIIFFLIVSLYIFESLLYMYLKLLTLFSYKFCHAKLKLNLIFDMLHFQKISKEEVYLNLLFNFTSFAYSRFKD